MTSRVDAVVDACYRKRLLRSRVIWRRLASYVILVLVDARDAYLVDCCSFADQANTLTQIVCAIVASAKGVLPLSCKDCAELVVLGINSGSDFIIMKRDVLGAKAARAMESDWSMHPLVVDVGGVAPTVVGEEALAAVGRGLADAIGSAAACGAKEQPVCYFEVRDGEGLDFVFLVGWLLGYPCIYRCGGAGKDEGDTFLNGNALSGLSLVKYSFDLLLCGEGRIDVMTFTAPSALLASGGLRASIEGVLQSRRESLNKAIAAAPPGLMASQFAVVQDEVCQMTNVSM